MRGRIFGCGGFVLGLIFGFGLLAVGGDGVAQETYVGDQTCSPCHANEYASYKKTGHPWVLYHSAGETPPADLFPWGVPLPALPTGVTWTQIQYIVGGYLPGQGNYVGSDGYQINNDGTQGPVYDCGNCHTTGYSLSGHQNNLPGIVGTWQLDGIQCENCHGPGVSYADSMQLPGKQICAQCHTDGDSQVRMRFTFTANGLGGYFSGNNPQADEVVHSPHKDISCVGCHDPHRSVLYQDGGVLFTDPSDPTTVGTMCTNCHNAPVNASDGTTVPAIRVRGSMGEIGLACTDCHMPINSDAGNAEATHIFQISDTNLAAANNTFQATDDFGQMSTWWNTDATGNAFLTLDMVCNQCHNNMSMDELAAAAATVHRAPGLVDLTINGDDSLQVVSISDKDTVSIDFNVVAGKLAGEAADWYVLCQGPKGWTSLQTVTRKKGKTTTTTTEWVKGTVAWKKHTATGSAIADVQQNVLSVTLPSKSLPAGEYTYWVGIVPGTMVNKVWKEGKQDFVSVPLIVTP